MPDKEPVIIETSILAVTLLFIIVQVLETKKYSVEWASFAGVMFVGAAVVASMVWLFETGLWKRGLVLAESLLFGMGLVLLGMTLLGLVGAMEYAILILVGYVVFATVVTTLSEYLRRRHERKIQARIRDRTGRI